MSNREPTKNSGISSDSDLNRNSRPIIHIILPKAFHGDVPGEYWKPGAPVRLCGQLASDHFSKQPTLTRKQLAELVWLFKDEPLPQSLREAVISELNGTRKLKQGRKPVPPSSRETCEQIMLPMVYEQAKKDAVESRKRLQREAQQQPRRAPKAELPKIRSIALDLVRERLPTFKRFSDQRLANLISEVKDSLREYETAEGKQNKQSCSDE